MSCENLIMFQFDLVIFIVMCLGVLIANTDTRWYGDVTASRYRFFPVITNASDIKRIHGHNERISIPIYLKMIHFYYLLMKVADKHS